MSNELSNKNMSLIMCNNEDEIKGKIIAESIVMYLVNGVYGVKKVVNDQFYNDLKILCTKPLNEYVDRVKKHLLDAYKMDCKKYGVYVISELIKHTMEDNVNIQSSIKQYFYVVNEKLLDEITKKIVEEYNK